MIFRSSIRKVGQPMFNFFKKAKKPVSVDSEKICSVDRSCKNLAVLRAVDKKAKNLEIPADVKMIWPGSFKDCQKLESVIFPETITGVSSYTFMNLARLKTVTFRSEEPISIGDKAIIGCANLESITISNEESKISPNAFSGCERLVVKVGDKTIPVAEIQKNGYTYEKKAAPNAAKEALVAELLPGATLIESEEVPSQAYYGMNDLESVLFAPGVKIIGEEAFSHCPNLKTVSFPPSLEEIGTQAFSKDGTRDSSLKHIILQDGWEKINGGLFLWCLGYNEITIPASIKQIAVDTFDECKGLTIHYKGTQQEWDALCQPKLVVSYEYVYHALDESEIMFLPELESCPTKPRVAFAQGEELWNTVDKNRLVAQILSDQENLDFYINQVLKEYNASKAVLLNPEIKKQVMEKAIEKAKKENQEDRIYFVRYVRPDVGCTVNFNCKDN